MEVVRLCATCGEHPRLPNQAYCRDCRLEHQRRWYREAGGHSEAVKERRSTPEYREAARNAKLRHHYNLSSEQFQEMLDAQGGVCAICGGPPVIEGNVKTFVVDHDHETGIVRGLLCAPCNRGLGAYQDDPIRLSLAADYLLRAVWRLAGGQT